MCCVVSFPRSELRHEVCRPAEVTRHSDKEVTRLSSKCWSHDSTTVTWRPCLSSSPVRGSSLNQLKRGKNIGMHSHCQKVLHLQLDELASMKWSCTVFRNTDPPKQNEKAGQFFSKDMRKAINRDYLPAQAGWRIHVGSNWDEPAVTLCQGRDCAANFRGTLDVSRGCR